MSISAQRKYALCDGNTNSGFYCIACDYTCSRKFLWKQHLETKKHKRNTNSNFVVKSHEYSSGAYNAQNICNTITCDCGRTYKHIQSYNRHRKTCRGGNQESEKVELRGMITTLIRQNQDMLTENYEMREMLKDVIPKIGNNNTTINNRFNLQIFLNEQCKDAINLTEFVETLELGLSDLDETRQNGYISGIASIIVRGLKELDLHKRPIHCSDLKREVLYVKDDDRWQRDNEDKRKIKQAIAVVANKQFDKIKEWEASNPTWETTESGTQSYIEIVKEVTTTDDDERSTNRIIKSIAKEVIIEK